VLLVYSHTYTYQFWLIFILIFNTMVLIFIGVLIVFTVSSFSKLGCLNFTSVMMTTIHLTSVHWIVMFGGNAGVLSQSATEAKNGS